MSCGTETPLSPVTLGSDCSRYRLSDLLLNQLHLASVTEPARPRQDPKGHLFNNKPGCVSQHVDAGFVQLTNCSFTRVPSGTLEMYILRSFRHVMVSSSYLRVCFLQGHSNLNRRSQSQAIDFPTSSFTLRLIL